MLGRLYPLTENEALLGKSRSNAPRDTCTNETEGVPSIPRLLGRDLVSGT